MESDDSMTSDSEGEDTIDGSSTGKTMKSEEDVITHLRDIKEADSPGSLGTAASGRAETSTTVKRPRGRPKKTPLSPSTHSTKVVKGRSKTGCFTCRRRKKKCDERKPGCLACEKNNVECDGFPPIGKWKGGKSRSEEGPKLQLANIPCSLPVIINGIETDIDWHFFDHFGQNLSKVLTLHDNHSNPFKDLLLPMAFEHQGLMHSLMALSGSHIIAKNPSTEFVSRKEHHSDHAISILRADMEAANSGDVQGIIEDPTVASTIVQCLICISDGKTNGEHRMHLSGAADLIPRARSKNPEFQKFIYEFFMYHEVSSSVTSLQRRSSVHSAGHSGPFPHFVLEPVIDPTSGVMVGVADGLFEHISAITSLRDTIRQRKVLGLMPTVSYESISKALRIDNDVRAWESLQEEYSTRWILAQLYRQCTWVYLFRTIQASKPSPKISQVVDAGLGYLRALPTTDSTQAVLLLPVFILGCAAFHQSQRPEIETAFETLQAYSNLGNIRPARRIVHKVWDMMDAEDDRSWDWETIQAEMDMDILVT